MSESDELGKLAELFQRGVLTADEFARAKARVLSGAAGSPQKAAPANAINALRRSRSDRWLGGVCAGIGQVTETPAWLWRLLFTFLMLCAGTGVLLYLLLWLFIPMEPGPVNAGQHAL